jgi:hypothetical protein
MLIKRINHVELHFNTKNDYKKLLFMKDDCEIIVKNLKTDLASAGGETIDYHRYDSLELWLKADDKKYDDHNFDSLKAIKNLNINDLSSIVIVYTDGSELMLHPTKDINYIAMNGENEFLHVMWT